MNPLESLPLAAFQESLPDGRVRCLLCPHHCVLKPGQVSRCLSRENVEGILRIRNYARVASLALDPIEKKPLHQFHPGKSILSIGTYGCNLACAFCQNWQISQQEVHTREIAPAALLRLAKDTVEGGNIGVAFTYNEPTIWYEYVRDTANLLHEANMQVVLVTNGFIDGKPLETLLPFIDAMNIDVKAFHPGFYEELCKGRLDPVLATVERAVPRCHVELTTLLIPGYNDAEEEMEHLARWIASLNPRIPLHLSRHHPDWKMRKPEPISIDRLNALAQVAARHLQTVVIGNVRV